METKNIEILKQKLEEMKQEIRERYDAGDVSDELTQKVLQCTRLANRISLMLCGGGTDD